MQNLTKVVNDLKNKFSFKEKYNSFLIFCLDWYCKLSENFLNIQSQIKHCWKIFELQERYRIFVIKFSPGRTYYIKIQIV